MPVSQNNMPRRSSGYIIEQLLITLAVCAFLIPVILICLGSVSRGLLYSEAFQDETGIAQLRHVINCASEIDTDGSTLSLTYHGNRMMLAKRGDQLDLLSPGTQIYLTDLTEVSFEINGGIIYLNYAHEGKPAVRRCLGYASEGLCEPVLSGDVSDPDGPGHSASEPDRQPHANSD